MTMRTLRVMPENFHHLTAIPAPAGPVCSRCAIRTLALKSPAGDIKAETNRALFNARKRAYLQPYAGDARHAVLFCLLLNNFNGALAKRQLMHSHSSDGQTATHAGLSAAHQDCLPAGITASARSHPPAGRPLPATGYGKAATSTSRQDIAKRLPVRQR